MSEYLETMMASAIYHFSVPLGHSDPRAVAYSRRFLLFSIIKTFALPFTTNIPYFYDMLEEKKKDFGFFFVFFPALSYVKLLSKIKFCAAENVVLSCLWLTVVFKIQCQNVFNVLFETRCVTKSL